ncbi:Gfo/Idh/MocA family protein [Phycisphaerales bacterium AB-hyl4]|uniref:Gfo/Idh/MocA family protein n=1 Tax=Natronomicrosphaera hydrolytica TaxID=3242702 RepID=A0ABV4U376_9BACT
MNKSRIGVVGCGVIGSFHVRSSVQSAYADAVAVADVNEASAQALADKHGVAKVYGDAQKLFADPDVDGVVLALPANLRRRLALAALQAGKHVLIEKPAALNDDEVQQIMAAQNGQVVMCCQNRYEFTPSARAAARHVASGALGKLRLVRVRGVTSPMKPPPAQPPVWRLRRDLNGGGIMANWGCYDLHYMLSVLNWSVTPQTVMAQMWPIGGPFADYADPSSDAETHLLMFVRCADEVVISFERAELLATPPSKAWEIIGENGTLVLEMTPGNEKQVVFYRRDPGNQGVTSDVIWSGEEDGFMPHQGTLDAFALAIQRNDGSPKPLRQASFVQRLTDAAYQSSETGQTVTVDFTDHGAALSPDEFEQVPTVALAEPPATD